MTLLLLFMKLSLWHEAMELEKCAYESYIEGFISKEKYIEQLELVQQVLKIE